MWTPELTLKVKRIGAVQPSPDGKLVAFAVREAVVDGGRSEYLTHIHVATADGSQSWQLTRGDKSCDDPQWSPDGFWLSFLSSRGGKRNIWLIRPAGGEAAALTNLKGSVSAQRWAPDSKSLAFTALDAPTADEERNSLEKNDARVIDENVKHHRLYVVPVNGNIDSPPTPRLLTPGDYSVGGEGSRAGRLVIDWSPDGKQIAFTHTKTPSPDHWTTGDVSIVDVATGAVRPVLATPGVAESSPMFSPDGKQLAVVISNSPPTWGGAARVHLVTLGANQPPRPLAETHDGFGRYSELIGWSADGKSLFFAEAHGADLHVMALPVDGSAPTAVIQASGMASAGVHLNPSRSHFGWAWETFDRPPEAMVAPVAGKTPTQVSRVNPAEHFPATGETRVVRWKSSDGQEVEGLLTLPVGYAPGRKCPLLLVVHGGPMGVFSRTYVGNPGTYPVAVFAARGYAVLRPNPRGSSGYGAKFRHANYGDWGGGDYRDLMTGVDELIKQGVADPERLGVMGWSYGGFMTSWIITQTKRFQAASVGAGVTNLMSFTGTADIPGFLPDYFHGEFWDDLKPYAEHSAMFRVKGVTTPTLIQHGERDERVPLSQGQELYNALKRQGCTTKMVVYPRTPHGIEEPRLLLDAMRRNLDWFEKHVPTSR